jgi:pyrroline-5-carboxylate reductase
LPLTINAGTLGIAILSGILASISETENGIAHTPELGMKAHTNGHFSRTPTKFIACVRQPQSAQHVQDALRTWSQFPVEILQNENVKGAQQADVVILCCKPFLVNDVLDVPGMREALKGKLLISILAGVHVKQIEGILYPFGSFPAHERCRIVRVMPNAAAIVRESMTVIAISDPPLPAEWDAIVTWIFTRIGRVARLPASSMDVSTALAGSGPAFMALVLEAVTDGAVAMGMSRAEAQLMACQAMRGTAEMVLNGDHPALIREKVSTPGGCTIGGLLVLEEAGVRGSLARSVREATVVASELGKGVRNANGTRH